MNLGPAFWVLAALGVVAASAYGLYFLGRPASWLRAGVKTLAIGAPAAGFVIAGAPFPLVLALVASALGDFFLAFDKKWVLPLGILSFLIAQLVYFVIFAAIWFFSGDNSPLWPRYLAMGVLIATTLGFLIWMAPKLGWMAFGVVPYSIAITAMAAAAMWLPWEGWPAMLGAVLFVVSDFVLATELFRLPEDAPVRAVTAPVVWWTYVGAQALIVTGILLAAM
ncbi:MAG TPA: lysoplasmalogenase family protein [Vitreimonas sp.]|nr:lysoplasmalogenase family protein [Vitreimonas sp.]